MKKIYRVLGKRGRITIPEEIRMIAGIGCNDILSFTIDASHCITLQKVEVCDEEKKKACILFYKTSVKECYNLAS